MNSIIQNNEPAIIVQEKSKVKLTGNQCREMTTKFWSWTGRSDNPAVAVLPDYEKFIASPHENTVEILGCEFIGKVRSAGHYVVTEWTEDNGDSAIILFEFEDNKAAQSFSKRLGRRKHQMLIAGTDCVRVVKVTPSTGKSTYEIVSTGRELDAEELSIYDDLPTYSYETLYRHLKKEYKARNTNPGEANPSAEDETQAVAVEANQQP